MVALPGQLFYTAPIPVCLWFLSKAKPVHRQGYHIGSGIIESAAKQIGAMRMKVTGAIWNEDGACKVAKARTAYLQCPWDECVAYRALSLVV